MPVASASRYSAESSGSSWRVQPEGERIQSSPGLFTASSVTSGRARYGSSGRRSCRSATSRPGLLLSDARGSLEPIDAPEVEIPRDEDAHPLPLVLHQGRRNVDGRL